MNSWLSHGPNVSISLLSMYHTSLWGKVPQSSGNLRSTWSILTWKVKTGQDLFRSRQLSSNRNKTNLLYYTTISWLDKHRLDRGHPLATVKSSECQHHIKSIRKENCQRWFLCFQILFTDIGCHCTWCRRQVLGVIWAASIMNGTKTLRMHLSAIRVARRGTVAERRTSNVKHF